MKRVGERKKDREGKTERAAKKEGGTEERGRK